MSEEENEKINKRITLVYENEIKKIDIEISELKTRIAKLRKERKKIYLKKYYLLNKGED